VTPRWADPVLLLLMRRSPDVEVLCRGGPTAMSEPESTWDWLSRRLEVGSWPCELLEAIFCGWLAEPSGYRAKPQELLLLLLADIFCCRTARDCLCSLVCSSWMRLRLCSIAFATGESARELLCELVRDTGDAVELRPLLLW
jgi:hypothetical protein